MIITKTMKYEIQRDDFLYKLLKETQYSVWKIKNKSVTLAYDWQQFSFGYNERFGEYPNIKELSGVTLAADINRQTKGMAPFVAADISKTASRQAVLKFEKEKSEILKGAKSVANYKKDTTFPVTEKQIRNLTKITPRKYSVDLSLLSREGAKHYGTKTQINATLLTGKGANVILDRIIDGSYKLCISEIGQRKGKWYLFLTYQFEKSDETSLDKNKIVGVDLGIKNAAYLATNFDDYKRFVIEGGEIQSFRSRIEARRRSMLRQSKYCGKGRRGHGRKTLLKPTEKLQDKVRNFRRTTNHKYAKAIVEFAEKNGCGVIQMEDLSGIASRDKFLANWSYYELQQLVEEKSNERGIEVRYVNPEYTSQRCSKCGYIAPGNRDIKKSQEKFECKSCGHKTNADFNAAKNIAEPRIEELIREQLERQKAVEKANRDEV